MKVILVPVADRPECVFALDTAFSLAKKFSSSVEGCHVRPHRDEMPMDNGARLFLSLGQGDIRELPDETISLNSHKAQELFRAIACKHEVALARKHRPSAQPLAYWQEMVGSPDRIMGIVGPVSDLLVVSKPRKRARGPARAFMLAAVLNSGKPVLVLPQKSVNPGKRICIAWNQSVEAARAVTAALPLLQRAELVHIVCSGKSFTPGPSYTQLRQYLDLWGVESTVQVTRGQDACKEILGQYDNTQSDLLVLGAYSRSHLRERILGGVTHGMLNEPRVSLFALHS